MVIFGSGARSSRLVRVLAASAACWSVACVWLASAEFRGYMRQTNPLVYSKAAHAFDYPSLWWAEARHVSYGPLDISIRIEPKGHAGTTAIMASGRPQNENQLKVARDAEGRVSILFAENERIILQTDPFAAANGTVVFHIEAPWLYPPAEHPYWDSVADPALRSDLQTRFSARWDGGSASIHSTHSADPVSFEPAILGAKDASPGDPWIADFHRAAPIPPEIAAAR
jgi:hypothetical protein